MKKALLIILMALIAIGTVYGADENRTSPIEDIDFSCGEIDGQILTNERHDVYIYNIPDECELEDFALSIDNETIDYHGQDVERGTSFRHIEGYFLHNFTKGSHTIGFEFKGNSFYDPCIKSFELEATDAIIIIPDPVVQGIYASRNVEVYLANGVEGDFEIYADGEIFHSAKITDKFCRYPIDSLSFGSHKIDVRAGPVSKSRTVNVTYYLDVELYANECLIVTTPWDVKNEVEVLIDGKRYAYTSNGITITGIGKHSVSVTYPGDDKYPKKTVNATFEIKAEPQIIAPATASTYYKDAKKITITAYELSSVRITFNSKTETCRAVDGKITFEIPKDLKPGKYTLKARSGLLYAQTAVTVKHLVTLKATSVKKSAKKLTLQATLKNKSPIKGKYVTFKFQAKTYKAKTNYKGIAKVTISKSVLKKLKVGKTVTYQATYGKDTIKKTAKVKK